MHEGTELCAPEFDAYKSLFRPSDWEEKDAENAEKVEHQVQEWMHIVTPSPRGPIRHGRQDGRREANVCRRMRLATGHRSAVVDTVGPGLRFVEPIHF